MTITYEYRHLGKPNPVHRATEPANAPIGQAAAEIAEAAHTPTPWEIDDSRERLIIRDVPGMCDGDSYYTIAEAKFHSLILAEEAKANAAFIVKAVNSHHTLWDRIRKVEYDNNDAAAQIAALREEIKAAYEQNAKLEAALHECREYFEAGADVVDGPNGEPKPNLSMYFCSMIDETLHGPGGF